MSRRLHRPYRPAAHRAQPFCSASGARSSGKRRRFAARCARRAFATLFELGRTPGLSKGPLTWMGKSNDRRPVVAGSVLAVMSSVPSRRLISPPPTSVPSRVRSRSGQTAALPSRDAYVDVSGDHNI